MGDFLEKLLLMSLQASVLVGIVILLRLLLKKAPKWISVALWTLVAVRLILPVSFQTRVSLMPQSDFVENLVSEMTHDTPTISETPAFTTVGVIETPGVGAVPTVLPEQNIQVSFSGVLTALWAAGCVSLLIWGGVSYFRLRRKVGASVKTADGAFLCDEIDSPFVLGIFRPKICLPSTLEGKKRDFVLSHEKAHIRRRDHLIKPFAYLLLSVYWFNPLFWLSYFLLCRDIEAACDERVIRDYSKADKALYSETLLSLSVPGRPLSACPVAFGEVGGKQRVKRVLNYKKPAFWVILIALILSISTAVFFLTDRITDISKLYPKAAPEIEIAVHNTLLDSLKTSAVYGAFVTEGEGHVILGTEEKEGKTYVYAVCSSVGFAYKNEKELSRVGTGISGPVVFVIDGENMTYYDTEKTTPEFIEEYFPKKYQKDALHYEKFSEELRRQENEYAELYLGMQGGDVTYMDIPGVDKAGFYDENGRFYTDQIRFDIDSDGIAEVLKIAIGPTSGFSTFLLTAEENGREEYSAIVMQTGHDSPGFRVNADGRLCYYAPTSVAGAEDLWIPLSAEDGRIFFEGIDERRDVEYWGTQVFMSIPERNGAWQAEEFRFEEAWKLKMELTNVTPTSATLTFHCGGYPSAESVGDPNGDEGTRLMTGQYYFIEVYKDGRWQPLETNPAYGFTAEGWILPTEGDYAVEMNWDRFYGTLPETQYGEMYRLGKDVSFFNKWGMSVGESQTFYAYFEIK